MYSNGSKGYPYKVSVYVQNIKKCMGILKSLNIVKLHRANVIEDLFYLNLYRFVSMLEPIRMGSNMAARKPTKELEELKSIKIIPFLIHELFTQPNSPK